MEDIAKNEVSYSLPVDEIEDFVITLVVRRTKITTLQRESFGKAIGVKA